MKSRFLWLAGCALVWSLSVTAAHAEGEKRATAGDRSAGCAREAKDLKGEEQQKFMADCLKRQGGNGSAGGHSQQNRMKSCNAEAGRKALHGDERRAFMSSCLRG